VGAPIVVQSMTNTDTADIDSTFAQTLELSEAGSEIVRWTVNVPEAAAAVPEIKKRLLAAGCTCPSSATFTTTATCCSQNIPLAPSLSTNTASIPENVGAGQRATSNFPPSAKSPATTASPSRIGVNGGSLNQELVMRKMQDNTDQNLGKESEEIINDCMVLSALESTELALESGLRNDQIIFPARPHARAISDHGLPRPLGENEQPLHLRFDRSGQWE